ncbi:MAG: hypothetical protein WA943_05040 [Parvibaculum sp.]|uniref:hypothetical protein n=1 Tax=Parvibaculum sp. TaxID=2024848 RepID=UPI003C796FAD
MMIAAGVSRWTMLHLGAAVVALLIAEVLLVSGYTDLIEGLRAPETLIAVHLLTVGWLSLLMLGALFQFVPVITNSQLFSQRLPIIGFVAIVVGLAGMIAGFAALGGNEFLPLACLPVGGVLVLSGLGIGAFNIAATLWRARPLPMQALFVAAGLGFLVLTGLIGICFALALSLPEPPAMLVGFIRDGLAAHVAGGLGGWFTLTAMGVSYRLLSMFMLAPEEARWTSYAALALTSGGLLLLMGAILFAGDNSQSVAFAGAFLAALGIGFYLADIVHLFRQRKRRDLELNSIAAAVALGFLAFAIASTTIAAITGTLTRFSAALGYLFVFGWLSGLGLSQLYKIVPFMTWLEVFGRRLGKGPVPRVQDLVNEHRARYWFVLFFGSVPIGAVAIAFANAPLFHVASLAQLVATILVGFELWHARHPDPDAAPKPLVPGAGLPFAKSPHITRTHGD